MHYGSKLNNPPASINEIQPKRPRKMSSDRNEIEIFGMTSTLHQNTLFVPIADVDDLEWFQTNYEPTDNDVFIVTYPKCGTTWLSKMCYEIMRCYHEQQSANNNTSHSYYARDNTNHSDVLYNQPIFHLRSISRDTFEQYLHLTRNTLRFWKIHSPKHLFPKQQNSNFKIIVISRNPKDACVSFYYHQKNITKNLSQTVYNGDFDLFFILWCTGLVRNDNYFTWHKEWYQSYVDKEDILHGKIHWMFYEDLNCKDAQQTRAQIIKLVRFLKINMDMMKGDVVHQIMKNTAFDKMKQEHDTQRHKLIKNHIRKGMNGDWKYHLNCNQSKIIDHLITLHFHNAPGFKYLQDLKNKESYLVHYAHLEDVVTGVKHKNMLKRLQPKK
eukprot:221319_1